MIGVDKNKSRKYDFSINYNGHIIEMLMDTSLVRRLNLHKISRNIGVQEASHFYKIRFHMTKLRRCVGRAYQRCTHTSFYASRTTPNPFSEWHSSFPAPYRMSHSSVVPVWSWPVSLYMRSMTRSLISASARANSPHGFLAVELTGGRPHMPRL